MLRMVPLLLVAFLVMFAFVMLVRMRAGALGGGSHSDPRVESAVRRVKDLAWDQRDLEPDLAGAVINRIRSIDERGGVRPGDLDDLLEIAFAHRETSPLLATAVIDLIRGEQRQLGG